MEQQYANTTVQIRMDRILVHVIVATNFLSTESIALVKHLGQFTFHFHDQLLQLEFSKPRAIENTGKL